MFASSLLRGLPTRVTALLQDPLHTSWKQVRQHCFPQDHCLLSKCRKAFTTLKKKERDRLGKAAFDNMSKTQREFSRQHAIATALQAEPIHTPGSRKRRYYDSQPPTARQTISPQWTSEPMVIDLVPTTSPDVLRGDESWAMSDDSMEIVDNDIIMDLGISDNCPLVVMADAWDTRYSPVSRMPVLCRSPPATRYAPIRTMEMCEDITLPPYPLAHELTSSSIDLHDYSTSSSEGVVTPPTTSCARTDALPVCERATSPRLSALDAEPDNEELDGDLADQDVVEAPAEVDETSADCVPPPEEDYEDDPNERDLWGLKDDPELALLEFQAKEASKYSSEERARLIVKEFKTKHAEKLEDLSSSRSSDEQAFDDAPGTPHLPIRSSAPSPVPAEIQDTETLSGNTLKGKEDDSQLLDSLGGLALTEVQPGCDGRQTEEAVEIANTSPILNEETAEGGERGATTLDDSDLDALRLLSLSD